MRAPRWQQLSPECDEHRETGRLRKDGSVRQIFGWDLARAVEIVKTIDVLKPRISESLTHVV